MSQEHELHPHEEGHYDYPPRKAYFTVGEMVLLAQSSHEPSRQHLDEWIFQLWREFKLGDEVPIVYPGYSENELLLFKVTPPISDEVPAPDSEAEPVYISFVHLAIPSLLPVEEEDEAALRAKDVKLIKLLMQFPKPEVPIPIGETDIAFRRALPNWCLAASGHSITDPGPGALPQPVDSVVITGKPEGDKHDTSVPDGAIQSVKVSRGINASIQSVQEVNVVIFDTAPPERLANACARIPLSNNPLLHRMKDREAAGKFTIKYALGAGRPSIDLPPNLEQTVKEYKGYAHNGQYNMSDHGLFIAGVIAGYVEPDSTQPANNISIYLVETQNHYGVGTITSLAQGIQALLDEKVVPSDRMDYPLVINCSLCVNFVNLEALITCYEDWENCTEVQLATLASADPHEKEEIESLLIPLLSLQQHFAPHGVRIIAASGNDSANRATPRETRFPAAFNFVVGVGATDKAGTGRMDYSNKGDVPPHKGLMTFGGKGHWVGGLYKTDTCGDGMLGLYIGEFPDEFKLFKGEPSIHGTPSSNGWAWWAGTSFATAVISGVCARAAASLVDITERFQDDYIEELRNTAMTVTRYQELMIRIPQLT